MKTHIPFVKWIKVAGLGLALGALAVVAFYAPMQLQAAGNNVVVNGEFEANTAGWLCKICTLSVGTPSQSGTAAQIKTTRTTGRAMMFQNNITLQPNTTYELKFWAQSNNGANLQVTLLQQSSPFTNYGIQPRNFDIKTTGEEFTYTFTTTGFSQTVSNARLRFRADKGKGLLYSIDNISLTATDGPPPPPPTPTPPPGGEMLIYDWNQPITIEHGGFAMDKTSQYLSQNWVQPINYADGTLYFRAEIYSLPTDKNQPDMKLGFCFWQGKRENCKGQSVPGVPGTVREWSFKLHDMWKKDKIEVDWAVPRTKMGFSVRDGQNDPVSNKTSSDWGGNNPAEWYPMNLRFRVVLVPPGQAFSGWANHP